LLHEQGWPHEHIELQLAHQERNAVSASYNHAMYLEPRARMMQAWAGSSRPATPAAHERTSGACIVNSERTLFMLGAIGAVTWKLVRLPIYYALLICEPILRIGLITVAVLGIFSAVVLEFSGSAAHFPFWSALLFFGCCGVFPLLHRALLRLFARQ
jgi:hypothetical protein